MVQRFSLIFAFAGLASQAQLGSGFMPISGKAVISNTIVFSSEYENPEEMQNNENPSEDAPETPQFETPAEIPQQPAATQPRPLDPLMASLTRMDPSTANAPTRIIPIFGEIPVDGSLIVLAPAAVIAVLGFIFSIVVTFNNQDEFVKIINQASQQNTNKVYDENVCRGLCSSQDQDLEGLRGFMESLRK